MTIVVFGTLKVKDFFGNADSVENIQTNIEGSQIKMCLLFI